VRRAQRLPVLVDAEERHVEVVARIGEVVRVAAVEGDLLLGHHHQAHVVVALEAVERVAPALVEAHHLAVERRPLGALALEGGDGVGALARLRRGVGRGDRRAHARRDVLDALQLLGVRAGHALSSARPRAAHPVSW
jgi:hypothetical protein